MKPARLVVDRTVIAEFSGAVPRALLRVFTPELYCGTDPEGLSGRRAMGREIVARMRDVGWGQGRALEALDEQIELALEAYAGLPDPVRRRLGWPADDTLDDLDAYQWIGRFAGADPNACRWLLAVADGGHPVTLLLACLLARPRARTTLWLRDSRAGRPVPVGRRPQPVASARELLLLQQTAQPANQGRKQP